MLGLQTLISGSFEKWKTDNMCSDLEGDSQNLQMINGRFKTTSGHFFANHMNIFHKTEVPTVILRC